MKKVTKGFLVAILMVFSFNVMAAGKIGIVSLQKIMMDSPEAKQISQKLEKQFKPRQEKLMAMQKSINDDMEKLKRDATIMSKSQKSALERKIMQAKRDFERQGQDFQQDLTMAQNQIKEKFMEKVRAAIGQVAQQDGMDLVLPQDVALYNTKGSDITLKVMKALK